MGLLKTLVSAKAVSAVVDYLDSKNRTGEYIPAGKTSMKARGAGLATVATSLARRNPKLIGTLGAGALAIYLAGVLVKRKQGGRPY